MSYNRVSSLFSCSNYSSFKHWELLHVGLVPALTNKCGTSDTVPVTDLGLKKARELIYVLGRPKIPCKKFNSSARETMQRP